MINKYLVLYAVATEDDDVGIFVDTYFIGGIVESPILAEELSKDLTNDQTIPGVVLPKTYSFNCVEEFKSKLRLATKHFNQLANDMYEAEEIHNRQRCRS